MRSELKQGTPTTMKLRNDRSEREMPDQILQIEKALAKMADDNRIPSLGVWTVKWNENKTRIWSLSLNV